jgi:predicted ArsR family transcriptional regulator
MTISGNAEKAMGTRDRIVRLLLKNQNTVSDLANKLGVTANAVRAQLALLKREGIVEIQNEVKGLRRPAGLYGLRPGADTHISKAYPIVLSHLVQVLAKKLDKTEFRAVMRELGQRLARTVPRPSGSPKERVMATLNILKMLGSEAEISEARGSIIISSYGCPIAEAVTADARSCITMEALLKELTGLPVIERCSHGEHPRCKFEIKINVDK